MPKVRVYQLAKELKVQSALILELLDRMGQEVKSDLSSLDEKTADDVRTMVKRLIERERRRLAEEKARAAQGETGETKTPAPPRPQPPKPAAARRPPRPTKEPAAVVTRPAAAAAPAPPSASKTASAKTAPKTQAPEVPQTAAASASEGARRPRVFEARRIPTPDQLRRDREARRKTGVKASGLTTAARQAVQAPTKPQPVPPRGAAPGKGKRKKRTKEQEREAAVLQPVVKAKEKAELPPVPSEIQLSEAVTVKELAEKLHRKSRDVIQKLLQRGMMVTINQPLDPEMAVEVAKEFGAEAKILTFEEEAQLATTEVPAAGAELDLERAVDRPEDLSPRPPVVTVMGHVDHGKTSLLDKIRETNVAARERGGITQHIGAYQVEKKERKITFLDTPGHEAFTMMRARGAKATDIVVLVVAADDGVKPQTIEAIDHAKAAEVPIVVAINKIDKPEANPARVKQQLAEHGVVVEDYGGDVVSVEVSAKTGQGLDDLLEMILLVADVHEFKARKDKPASGVVLETRLDKTRGILATVLIQEGTLKVGDAFIAGSAFGKVRAMMDAQGRRIPSAGPSAPVEIMGFDGEPSAGDLFQVVEDEARARQIAAFRQEKERQAALARHTGRHRTLEDLSKQIASGTSTKELPLLLKADVQGSLEAIQKALGELPSEKIRVNVIRASIGAITQADVLLAAASSAIVVGFNVRPDRATAELARQEGVEIRLYTVIYDLVNEIKQAMVGMLEPTYRETVLGQAEVRQLFRVPKIGVVAGCMVVEGKAARNAEVRLIRDNVVVYTGKVGSLRRFKEDVSEVKQGFECGISIANFQDIKEGDVIEFFVTEEVAAQSL